jgi:hypothetical protein
MKAGKVGGHTKNVSPTIPPIRFDTAPLRQVEYPAQEHRAAVPGAKVHILRRDGAQLAPEDHADVYCRIPCCMYYA